MKTSYDACLTRLLKDEGGYSNHPSDPGGPTNFGITIEDYRMYCNPSATADDVRHMDIADAKNIYRTKYWGKMRCDDLPPGVDYAIFDYGVNSGVGRAGKVLRRLIGLPDNTSVINDDVIRAVKKREPLQLADAINDERINFLQHLKTWNVFGRGWGRRVAGVRAYCHFLATGHAVTGPEPEPTTGKGHVGKTNNGPVVGAGAAASGVSIVALFQQHPVLAVVVGVVVFGGAIIALLALKNADKTNQEAPVTPTPVVPEVPVVISNVPPVVAPIPTPPPSVGGVP